MELPSLSKSEFYALLDLFLKRLETELNEDTIKRHSILNESALKEGRRGYHEIGYDEGQRFVKYFVEKATGIIFGTKSWKAYNPNHTYGDLTTIDEWEWGGYRGVSKKGMDSLVPPSMRR
jgi:hypothetical protein